MRKRAHPQTVFLVLSLLLTAGVCYGVGVVFGSRTAYFCAALIGAGAIGVGFRQTWCIWLALAGVMLGVGALYLQRELRWGENAVGVGMLSFMGYILFHYARQTRRHERQVRKAARARPRDQSAATALGFLAQGLPPPVNSADSQASGVETPLPSNFRSLVLLTRGQPEIDRMTAVSRLARWMGVRFTDRKDEADNFFVVDDPMTAVKLKSENMYLIMMLHRSYWDTEDVEPYVKQARMQDNEELARELESTDGAILIDAHFGNMPDTLLGLAKIAAACVSANTKILVSPVAFKAEIINRELVEALVRAKTPADLLGPLCNVVSIREGGWIRSMTRGMRLLSLPDIVNVVEDTPEQFDRAWTAVQSAAIYQAEYGEPIPVGDTCTVDGIGTYRFTRVPDRDPTDMLCLIPCEPPASE